MDEYDLFELLREKLSVVVDFKHGNGYWEDNRFVVRLLWDGKEISGSSVSVPTWEEKRSDW